MTTPNASTNTSPTAAAKPRPYHSKATILSPSTRPSPHQEGVAVTVSDDTEGTTNTTLDEIANNTYGMVVE